MPKLITRTDRKVSKIQRTKYGKPSSPFQAMIDTARAERGLSFVELAKLITKAGAKVSSSTLWLWIHTTNGAPHARSFKPAHAQATAKALGLNLADLQRAYDASHHTFTAKQNPLPHAHRKTLEDLISILENDRRTYISRVRTLNLLRRLLD